MNQPSNQSVQNITTQQSNNTMLKRRPSKRFVLAETGEETAWDTTTDNDPLAQLPQIDIGFSSDPNTDEECPRHEIEAQPIAHPIQQRLLSVPVTLKSGMK